MQPTQAPQNTAAKTVPTVGPLGGIIYCALCLATYAAIVLAIALS